MEKVEMAKMITSGRVNWGNFPEKQFVTVHVKNHKKNVHSFDRLLEYYHRE